MVTESSGTAEHVLNKGQPNLKAWRHHWQEEADAAFLYGELAKVEPDLRRKEIFSRLVQVENRHVDIWRNLLAENGVEMGAPSPSASARWKAWIARRFGPGVLLNQLLREEGEEVKGYLNLHRASPEGKGKDAALRLAQESAHHAETLKGLSGGEGEPWHRAESGGFLRNVVYGFNDGLTANFGLVAGAIGANLTPQVVLVTGLAGIVADALSMGSSGYLAAKSEQEVYDHEIEMEKEEMRLMPEVEQEELALIYEAKGHSPEESREMAARIMRDPERALREKVREELKIGEAHSTPIKEGVVTGTATAVGALLPVLPFFVLERTAAIWVSFSISMLSHFGVGAMRSLFTGRGIIRSGMDMFVVGFGVAALGYLVGDVAVRWLGGM